MIDYAGMASKGVAVVGPFYVNEFLLLEVPPKIESHIIDEYKPFWAKRDKKWFCEKNVKTSVFFCL